MGWYKLSWPKALLAFTIDIAGYILFGPFIFIRSFFSRTIFSHLSILLLRLDHMGDVLMATPAIIALKKHFPSAQITVGVKGVNCGLISLPDIVDRVAGLDAPWVVDSEDRKRQWLSFFRKIKELRDEKFDLAIDFKGDLRNITLLFLIGARERISYSIRGGGFLLNRRAKFISGPRHEIERNLDILRAFVRDVERVAPRYEVDPEKEAEVENFISTLFVSKGKKFIGIHPGASSPSKRWPVSRFAELANKIEKNSLGRVVVFVGPNEMELVPEIKSLYNPIILGSEETLPSQTLAAFLKKLDLFIGNDSGPFHLAEAVGTKVITIFGSTYPEIVGPISRNSEIIRSRRNCAPCRRPGEKERCGEISCLKDISVEEVYEVVRRNLI